MLPEVLVWLQPGKELFCAVLATFWTTTGKRARPVLPKQPVCGGWDERAVGHAACFLGVATPVQVVSATDTTSAAAVADLVRSATEAAPTSSEAIARAGLLLLGSDPAAASAIAEAAVQGLVDAGADGAVIAHEAAEIASALSALVPETVANAITQAIANTTPDTTDTTESIQEVAGGVETADQLQPVGSSQTKPLLGFDFVEPPAVASPN